MALQAPRKSRVVCLRLISLGRSWEKAVMCKVAKVPQLVATQLKCMQAGIPVGCATKTTREDLRIIPKPVTHSMAQNSHLFTYVSHGKTIKSLRIWECGMHQNMTPTLQNWSDIWAYYIYIIYIVGWYHLKKHVAQFLERDHPNLMNWSSWSYFLTRPLGTATRWAMGVITPINIYKWPYR